MVAITFRSTGAWGSGVGRALTITELDTNFGNLKAAVEGVIASPPAAVSISSITSSGNTLTVHLSDSTTQGPFTVPAVRWHFSGAFQTSHAYAVDDVFTYGGACYIVRVAHTSTSGTFDPAATDGLGHDLYSQLVDSPLPIGGTTYQVLGKVSGVTGDVAWQTPLLERLADVVITQSALTIDDVLLWDGAEWINAPLPSIALTDLSDTLLTGGNAPVYRSILFYDGTRWTSAILPLAKVAVLTGGAGASTFTVSGITTDDRIDAVLYFAKSGGNLTDVTALTGWFASAADTVTAGATNTTGGKVVVYWSDISG